MAGPKLIEKGKRPQQGELKGILKKLGFIAEQVCPLQQPYARVLRRAEQVSTYVRWQHFF